MRVPNGDVIGLLRHQENYLSSTPGKLRFRNNIAIFIKKYLAKFKEQEAAAAAAAAVEASAKAPAGA